MVNSESMDSSGDGKPKDYITQLNSGGGSAGISIDTHSPSPVTASSVRLRDMDFDANESAADITSAECANPIDSLPETAVTRSIHEENFRLTQQAESEISSLYCSVPLNKVQDVLSSYSVDSPNAAVDDCGDAKVKKLLPRRLLCLYCDRTFVTSNLRQKHVDRCHSVKQATRSSSRFQTRFTTACIFCKKLNNTDHTLNDLFKHLVERHSNKYFACVPCEERFVFKAHLEDHLQQKHEQKRKARVPDEVLKVNRPTVAVESSGSVEDETNTLKTKHKTKIKRDTAEPDNQKNLDTNRPNLRMSVRKELRKKKVGVKSTKTGVKRNTRLQTKVTNAQTKTPVKKRTKTRHDKGLELPEKPPSSSVNPYPTFDAFFRVKKITDHSIDNLKISSLTFDDVFDKAFYNRIKCNIQENLQNHIDGKLFKNEESESRISNFEKNQELNTSPTENFGCDISLNAATPVVSLLSSQLGEDFESQIEYGAKASKKKPPPKKDEVHYKYFTRRKYQASILESKENRDLSKLDMWTQLVVKDRQQKIINDKKTEKERIEYTKGIEYRTKMQNVELNRILDRRGPFEDLKEEANKKAALEKYNRLGESVSCEAISDVASILHDLIDRVFDCSENPVKIEENDTIVDQKKPQITDDDCEIPFYLNLRRNSSLIDQPDIDKSDRITLICSSQETENFEETTTPRDKNSLVELTGEWTRTRIYICAACGVKVPNMKHLVDHKSVYHQNVWVQHYEFVGNQSVLYKHLSIPGLGKVGHFEVFPTSKSWKRSDSRLCTKCSRMCNTLGELHRHMLECGEDWSWMLARKKLKYRPFGAKSRRKRRGLVKRIIHKEKSGDEVREKRKYNVKRYDGPRPKPSDAETIQRMLANLPAKRATRKLISLKDGFPKQIRRKQPQKGKNSPISKSAKNSPSAKKQTAVSNLQTQKKRGRKKKGLKCNPMILRKSMRNINKIFSSKILDSNSTLLVKRKIKTVLQHQRITRARKMLVEEETADDKSTENSTCPKKKEGLIGKVKMLTKAVKRTVLKKDEKKVESSSSAPSVNPSTSVVNKNLTRTTRHLKKSDSLEDTIKDIINSIDASDTNSDKSKEIVNKKKIDGEQSTKSETEDASKAEISKKKPKLVKKETVGTKLARTLSLRKLRKKNTEEEKLKTQSNPELVAKTVEEKVKNGKRKLSLDSFKNKIKKMKLKDKSVPQIAQVDGSSQISDEILPFLEKIHIDSDENQEKSDESKNTETPSEGASLNETPAVAISPVKELHVKKEEMINTQVQELKDHTEDHSKQIQSEIIANSDNLSQMPDNISKNINETVAEVTTQQTEGPCNDSDHLIVESLPEKSDEGTNLNEATMSVIQKDCIELDNNVESNPADTKTCTSTNKTKSKKRSKGLNDCIAMLTSKLQQKVEEIPVNVDVVEASDKCDIPESDKVPNKEIPSKSAESKQFDVQERPGKETAEYNHPILNSNNVITSHLGEPKIHEANHKIIENIEKNRQELLNLQTRFIAEQQQLLLQHIYRQLPNYSYNYIPAIPREANFLINNIMFNGQNQIGDKFLQLNQNPDHNVAKLLGSIDRNNKFKEVDVNIEFDIMKYLGNVADNCVVKLEKLKSKSNNEAKKKTNNKAGGARRCNNKRKENINVITSHSKEQDALNKILINEKSIENDESKHRKQENSKENDKVIDLKINEKPEDLTQCHNSKKSLEVRNSSFVAPNQSANVTGVKAFSNAEVSSNGSEVIDLKMKNNIELGKEANLFEQLTRNGISIALFPCPQTNQKKSEISTEKIEAIDLKITKPRARTADKSKLSTEQTTTMENLISLPNKFNVLSDTQSAINLKINHNLEASKKDFAATQEDKNTMGINMSIFNNKGLFAPNPLVANNTVCPKFPEIPFGEKIITPFTAPKPAKSFQSVFEESYKLLNMKPPKKAEKKKKISKASKQKLQQNNVINSFSENNEKLLLSKNEGNRAIIEFKVDKIPAGNSMNTIKPCKELNLVFPDQKLPQICYNNSNQAMDLKINKNSENNHEIKSTFSSSNNRISNPLVPQSISKEAHAVSFKSDIKNLVKEKKRIILKPPQFIATSLEKRPIIENQVIQTFQAKSECLNATLPNNIDTEHTNGVTKSVKKKNTAKGKNVDNIDSKIKTLFLEEKEPDVMEEKTLTKMSSSRSSSKDKQSKNAGNLQESKCAEGTKKIVLNKSDTDSDDDIPLANLLKESLKKAAVSTPMIPMKIVTPPDIEKPPASINNVAGPVLNSNVLDVVHKDILDTVQKFDSNIIQKLDINTEQKLDTNTVQKLDTNIVQKLDTNIVQKLDTNIVEKLDTNIVETLDTNIMQKLDTNIVQKLDANIVQRFDTDVALKLDTNIVQELDTNTLPKLDTNTVQNLDTNAVQNLDTNAVQNLDTNAVQNLDTNTIQNLDTNTIQNLDINTVQNLDTNTVQNLDTNTVQNLDTNIVQKLDTNTVQTWDTNTVQTLDTNTVQTVGTLNLQKLDTHTVQPVEEIPPEIQSNLIPSVMTEIQTEVANEAIPCESEEAKSNGKKPRIRKRTSPIDKKEKVKKKPASTKTPKSKGTPLYDESDAEFQSKAARKIKISCQIFQKSSKIVLDKNNIFNEAENEEEEEESTQPETVKPPEAETILPDIIIKEELSTEPTTPAMVTTEVVSRIKEELPDVEENDPEAVAVESEQFFPIIPESTISEPATSQTIEDLELEIRRRIKLSNLQLKRENIEDSQAIPAPINTDIIYEVDSPVAQEYNEESNIIVGANYTNSVHNEAENSLFELNNEILPTDTATINTIDNVALPVELEMIHTNQNVNLFQNMEFEQNTSIFHTEDHNLEYNKEPETVIDNTVSNLYENIQNDSPSTFISKNIPITTEETPGEPIAAISDGASNVATNFTSYQKKLSETIDNIKENSAIITLTNVEETHDEENNTEMNFDVESEKEGDLPTENANTAPNLAVLEEYKQPPMKDSENKSKKSKKKHEEAITDVIPAAYGEFQVNSDGINKITISRKKLQVNHNSSEATTGNDIYVVKKMKKTHRKSTNNKEKKKRKSSLLSKESHIESNPIDNIEKTISPKRTDHLEDHPNTFENDNLENVEFEVQNEEIGRKLKINKKKVKEIPPATNLEASTPATNSESLASEPNLEPSIISNNITEDIEQTDVIDIAKDYDDLPKDMEIEEFQVEVPIIETNFDQTKFDIVMPSNIITHALNDALSAESYSNKDLFQIRDQKSPMPSILTYRSSGLNNLIAEQPYKENFETTSKDIYFTKDIDILHEKTLEMSNMLVTSSVYNDRYTINTNSNNLNLPYSGSSVNSLEDLSTNSAYDSFSNTQTCMNVNAISNDGNLPISKLTTSGSTTKKGRKSKNAKDKNNTLHTLDGTKSLLSTEDREDSNKESVNVEPTSKLDDAFDYEADVKQQSQGNVDESKTVDSIHENIPRYVDVNMDEVDSMNYKVSKKSSTKKNKNTKSTNPSLTPSLIVSNPQAEELKIPPKTDSGSLDDRIEIEQSRKSKKLKAVKSTQENDGTTSFDMMCDELQALCDAPLELRPLSKSKATMDEKTNKDPTATSSESDLTNPKEISTSSNSFCDNIKSSCDAKINELLREIDSSPRLGKKPKKLKNIISKSEDCDVAVAATNKSGDIIEEANTNKLTDDGNLEKNIEEEIPVSIQTAAASATPENVAEQLLETNVENIGKTTPNIVPPSKAKSAKATKSPKKKSAKAKKERSFSMENTEELYCDICDKMFARSENLVKHKRTLTHIAKLSEIEAKEAQAKAKNITETQTTNQPEEAPFKMDINISDILNNSEKLAEQQQDLNSEIANKIHVNSPFVLKTSSDTLKLADIINDVLNKPVENEKHASYSESHMSQTAHAVTKNETKRYKSLGERKSFESDIKTTYPFNTMTVTNDSIPKLSNSDTILKQQLSILENIIETEGPFGYIDDITISSSKSVEEPLAKSPSELSIMSKNDDSNQLAFTHNSSSIINTLIKPDNHNQTFIKPTQYEEISNDSSSVRNQFDDQRSRKVLNRDEELFLECCSLLKSSSEVSGYSKRSSRTVHVLNNFEMKQTDEEPEWLERKTFAPKNQEYKHDVFQNSCPNTPLGDGYGDDCSNTNSNTIVTDWSTKQKEQLQENPAFEDISLDSKGSTNMQQEIGQFKAVEHTFGDFQLFNTEREKDLEVNDERTNTVVATESVEENINEKEADEDFKKKMVSRFGGLMAKAWRNSVQVVKKNKAKKKPSTEVTQTSITDYAVPLAAGAKPDNDLNDSKKMLTKGAMKVFEGLKVSIPTDDLDMKELLSTSHVAKKQEDELHTQPEDTVPKESEPLKEDPKVSKNNVISFGNRLGLKVTKKKQSILKPKEPLTPTAKTARNEDETKKGHDVYDFEETQDNTDIFSTKLPNLKDFRNQIAEKKISSECTINKEPTPVEDPEESDSDSRQGGCIDSFNYEAQSLSSFSTESSSSLKKPKKKNITKKKCMIMGRIFKNAFKSKVEEDIRDIPSVDNAKLVEDYVMQLPQKEEKRPKLTEQEMDMLFDKLLEDKTPVEEATKNVENPTAAISKPAEKPAQPKQKPKSAPKRKRQRHNSDSTDDEFSLSKTKKRYNKKKPKNIDDSINLEQELKECIGVASRKSQRKCTSGKQNVLVEFWSSDDSNFEAFLRETAMDKTKNSRSESKVIESCDNGQDDAKPMEASVEEAFKDLADTIKKATPKIEMDNQKNGVTQSVDPTPSKPEKLANVKQTRRKSSTCNKFRVKNDDEIEDKKMKNIKVTAETLAANRRKRAASNTLYYWSSSSEDESQDLIEIKPVRDELDEDEDRPMQHGWIVGDSPKKLVTMLAQAKGKKVDADSVKEQGKKRTTM